ncbi:MAG: beta-propeller domain-containing protein [Methanomicrobiales archaeon]|nr:beta-propeller domain-containing protein [Methanomicrobiales archaeon]
MSDRRVAAFAILGIAVIAAIMGAALVREQRGLEVSGELKKFASEEEILAFLESHAEATAPAYGGGGAIQKVAYDEAANYAPAPIPALGIPSGSRSAGEYSTTNVQVKGVDEADFLKNDGKHIYLISGSTLAIVDAYPAEKARIVSETELEGQPVELFLLGDRLVIFSNQQGETFVTPRNSAVPVPVWRTTTHATVYDVRNRSAPKQIRDIGLSGSYYDARMIGSDIYVVTSEGVPWYRDTVVMPEVREGEKVVKSPDVYYFDIPCSSYTFYTLSSFDILNDRSVTAETFMLGYSTTLYVSRDNLYMAYQKESRGPWTAGAAEERAAPAGVVQEEATIIHRFEIDRGEISYAGMGEVAGRLLNQFSMDEWEGNLRVATTVSGWAQTNSYQYRQADFYQYSTVSVLGKDMRTLGELRYIAPDEQIYATRFVGDRLYMVTFKKIDPFFVIDLSDPKAPGILGKLKIPGYSDYLHPYDNNHIIGIGKETAENQWGGISVEGLKIALFDVTDVNNPKLLDRVEIGESGTDSEALYDHKAFLFDKEKNILVIPVREVKRVANPESKYGSYAQKIWQGAYVFSIAPESGFELRGTVTHEDEDAPVYYWGSPSAVRRSLYMDDVLYTVSSRKIVMNRLTDIDTQINQVLLPYRGHGGVYPPVYR